MANRDVKNSSRSSSSGRTRAAGKSGGGGMVAGIVIGLIVGVAVAVGLAMYLNRSATPFSNLEKLDRKTVQASSPSTELLEPGTKIADVQAPAPVASAPAKVEVPAAPVMPPEPSVVPAPPAKAKPAAAPAGNGSKDEQRFDFYKILPGQVDAVPADGKTVAKDREPSAAAPAKKVFLQLGAFQNENEADNLKAKLALLGVEAKIQSVMIPDKGMVHRVRVGPLSRQEDVDRVRAQLKQDGINAAVVKAE
ncbi:SPOR domain-containing protein [Aquitalea sp.]|uniref:SPOR domain-containing protein n=1 Tax=Aquitalea sp. TaxID=1872623 RepID=UPI0025911C55|nr:SPOR domain-containing protein [Aquitalea sp.]